MHPSLSSQTALWAATYRSDHQILEQGLIFKDPFARRLIGLADTDPPSADHDRPPNRRMRLFMAARSRFAEDRLAEAFERGVRQLVLLGAGLDTFSLRNPMAMGGLRVFEVDHPATQAWKRERLGAAGLAPSSGTNFVAVDFERDDVLANLSDGGFNPEAPSFFIWLGVVPYLVRATVTATLAAIARLPRPEIVLDYTEPFEAADTDTRAFLAEHAETVRAFGEPWITFFGTDEIASTLHGLGFDAITDFRAAAAVAHYLNRPPPAGRTGGGHALHARVTR